MFRVTLALMDGTEAAMELVESRSEADRCFDRMQTEEIASAVKMGTVSIEEMCHGTWVPVCRRLIGA